MCIFTVNVYIIIINPREQNIKTSVTELSSYLAVFKTSIDSQPSTSTV